MVFTPVPVVSGVASRPQIHGNGDRANKKSCFHSKLAKKKTEKKKKKKKQKKKTRVDGGWVKQLVNILMMKNRHF